MRRLKQLRRLYGVKRVYLATDSETMVDYVLQKKDVEFMRSKSPSATTGGGVGPSSLSNEGRSSGEDEDEDDGGFEWIFLDLQRKQFNSSQWIENRHNVDFESVSFSAAADLWLLSQGDIFVGALTGKGMNTVDGRVLIENALGVRHHF